MIYVRTSHNMRNTSDRQASIRRWLIEAFPRPHQLCLCQSGGSARPGLLPLLRSQNPSSMTQARTAAPCKMLLDAFKWSYGTHFHTIQLQHVNITANVFWITLLSDAKSNIRNRGHALLSCQVLKDVGVEMWHALCVPCSHFVCFTHAWLFN